MSLQPKTGPYQLIFLLYKKEGDVASHICMYWLHAVPKMAPAREATSWCLVESHVAFAVLRRSELRRGRHVNTGTDESSRPEPCVIMTPTYHRRRRGQTAHKSRKPAGIRASFLFMLLCTINFTAEDFTRVCVLLLDGKTRGRDNWCPKPGTWRGPPVSNGWKSELRPKNR